MDSMHSRELHRFGWAGFAKHNRAMSQAAAASRAAIIRSLGMSLAVPASWELVMKLRDVMSTDAELVARSHTHRGG
jgi:dihydrodipicolinate reductase